MAEETSPRVNPFDLDRLKELIRFMEEHGLTELDLQRGDDRCRLQRGMPAPLSAAPQYHPAATPFPAAGPPAATTADDGLLNIKSPMVGTFYVGPSPDDPPFAPVGTKVAPDTVVCLIEAMKVYNQITADVSGTIAEVCVNNGDAVEYGQVLFKVRAG